MATSCLAGFALVLALSANLSAAFPQDYAGQELLDEVRQLLSLASTNVQVNHTTQLAINVTVE